jgi:hypothetical protein
VRGEGSQCDGSTEELSQSSQLTADEAPPDAPLESHPQVPTPSTWPGALLIGIVGWFAMCAVIGIVVQTNAPLELLPRRSHAEPPPEDRRPDDEAK